MKINLICLLVCLFALTACAPASPTAPSATVTDTVTVTATIAPSATPTASATPVPSATATLPSPPLQADGAARLLLTEQEWQQALTADSSLTSADRATLTLELANTASALALQEARSVTQAQTIWIAQSLDVDIPALATQAQAINSSLTVKELPTEIDGETDINAQLKTVKIGDIIILNLNGQVVNFRVVAQPKLQLFIIDGERRYIITGIVPRQADSQGVFTDIPNARTWGNCWVTFDNGVMQFIQVNYGGEIVADLDPSNPQGTWEATNPTPTPEPTTNTQIESLLASLAPGTYPSFAPNSPLLAHLKQEAQLLPPAEARAFLEQAQQEALQAVLNTPIQAYSFSGDDGGVDGQIIVLDKIGLYPVSIEPSLETLDSLQPYHDLLNLRPEWVEVLGDEPNKVLARLTSADLEFTPETQVVMINLTIANADGVQMTIAYPYAIIRTVSYDQVVQIAQTIRDKYPNFPENSAVRLYLRAVMLDSQESALPEELNNTLRIASTTVGDSPDIILRLDELLDPTHPDHKRRVEKVIAHLASNQEQNQITLEALAQYRQETSDYEQELVEQAKVSLSILNQDLPRTDDGLAYTLFNLMSQGSAKDDKDFSRDPSYTIQEFINRGSLVYDPATNRWILDARFDDTNSIIY